MTFHHGSISAAVTHGEWCLEGIILLLDNTKSMFLSVASSTLHWSLHAIILQTAVKKLEKVLADLIVDEGGAQVKRADSDRGRASVNTDRGLSESVAQLINRYIRDMNHNKPIHVSFWSYTETEMKGRSCTLFYFYNPLIVAWSSNLIATYFALYCSLNPGCPTKHPICGNTNQKSGNNIY